VLLRRSLRCIICASSAPELRILRRGLTGQQRDLASGGSARAGAISSEYSRAMLCSATNFSRRSWLVARIAIHAADFGSSWPSVWLMSKRRPREIRQPLMIHRFRFVGASFFRRTIGARIKIPFSPFFTIRPSLCQSVKAWPRALRMASVMR